jgi:hypothetical protein
VVDVWVCNSSPLISLARIGRLDLIKSLAAKAHVPATIVREIEAPPISTCPQPFGRGGSTQAKNRSSRPLRKNPAVTRLRNWSTA